MKVANDNIEKLNADAIYAAMAWLRKYAESPEGQKAVSALLEQKGDKVDFMRSIVKEATGAHLHIKPVFDISDETIEEIYPGESISVECGIELGRSVIWGQPAFATAFLQGTSSNGAPIREALSRFIADRAN
ncbi:MAG: hypothetical protein IIA64_10570 [Planctomycetes bacterium]|nr:hypothetical protein [Planctomycetota bacterium]